MNFGGRRKLTLQPLAKSGEPLVGALDVDDHPLGRFLDPAG